MRKSEGLYSIVTFKMEKYSELVHFYRIENFCLGHPYGHSVSVEHWTKETPWLSIVIVQDKIHFIVKLYEPV